MSEQCDKELYGERCRLAKGHKGLHDRDALLESELPNDVLKNLLMVTFRCGHQGMVNPENVEVIGSEVKSLCWLCGGPRQ